MDIGGTAKKVQRVTKIAEESYKKMQAIMEQMQEMMKQMKQLQSDMETTTEQVGDIEYELAEQRVLLESLAEQQGVDVEEVLASADLPEPPQESEADTEADEPADDLAKKATSKPSASDE
ncbi:DUF5798 family protein [Halovenus rubra]|uniref:DUF5798 family protein n=2 Tax=Halovenus rubra TaxID=869890 RepID=A0ACC7E4F9_9EURY|nr:DUF5798 family protein [Halovenus rubra]